MRTIITLVLLLVMRTLAIAQNTPLWTSSYANANASFDAAKGISIDGSSNVYICGSTKTASNQYDITTVKYNSSGTQQWAVSYNNIVGGNDEGWDVTTDASSNVYITGWSQGTGTNYDVYTAKYNSSGSLQWGVRYNNSATNGWDEGKFIEVDGSGNTYIAGRSQSTISGINNDDFLLLKYNSSGTQQFAARYTNGGVTDDWCNNFKMDASGNCYLAGEVDSNFISGVAYNRYPLIVKYNSSGTLQWARKFYVKTLIASSFRDVEVDASGNVYCVGYVHNANTYKTLVAKYNSSGTMLWADTSATSPMSSWYALLDGSGNLYVAQGGYSNSPTYVTKYNSSGTILWSTYANGLTISGLKFDSNGNIVAVGSRGSQGIEVINPSGNIIYHGFGVSGGATGVAVNSTGAFCTGNGGSLMSTSKFNIYGFNVLGIGTSGCPGASATVSYGVNGLNFNTGNTFTVELSNPAGSFASPTVIGTLTGESATGSINCVLPTNLTNATYQVRIQSTNPAYTSYSTGVALHTSSVPNVSITNNYGNNTICSGDYVPFTGSYSNAGSFPTYYWTINGVDIGNYTTTYSNTTFANGDQLQMVVIPDANLTCPANGYSNIITMTVCSDCASSTPSIVSSNNECLNTTLTATAGIVPSQIQWRLNSNTVQTTYPAPVSVSTAAGGNGAGNALNQLNLPNKIFVDGSNNIYVADYNNNRVLKFPAGSTSATNGTVVAGGNGSGSGLNQLSGPQGVFVDANDNLYVSEYFNARVIKFPAGSTSATFGTIVAGGNGIGSTANKLSSPEGIFVDATGNLFVADAQNNRIQKFPAGSTSSTNGITVAGAAGPYDCVNLNQFQFPHAVVVDALGYIYVADGSCSRVLRFPPASTSSTNGTIIAGGNGFGSDLNKVNFTYGLCFDAFGNVFVVDNTQHRILKFSAGSTQSTNGVIFAGGNGQGNGPNQLNGPMGVAVGPSGDLFVSDRGNHRVQKITIGINNTFTPEFTGNYTAVYTTATGCKFTSNTVTINSTTPTPASNTGTWSYLGTSGFTSQNINYTSLVTDVTGKPYVAFKDPGNANKATVMMFNGTTWQVVGSAGFSDSDVDYLNIAIGPTGTLYVVYQDAANSGKATVKKYDGISWVTVGSPGISAGTALYTAIAVNMYNTPYIVYADGNAAGKATVKGLSGSSWFTAGTAGFSTGSANWASISARGLYPVVAFSDGGLSNKAVVMQFDGSNWSTTGGAPVSTGQAAYLSVTQDNSNYPYVVYSDNSVSNKASSKKYNGSTWVSLGSNGFSAAQAEYTTIKLDANNNPVVAYKDWGNQFGTTVMKFNGVSWSLLGNAGFSSGQGDYVTLALNPSGTPIVAFSDYAIPNGGAVSAMKFTPTPAPVTGNATPCPNTSETYSVAAATGATSYTWSLPSGWSGTSTTNTISVTTGSSSGTISVTANNTCGSAAAHTLAVIPSTCTSTWYLDADNDGWYVSTQTAASSPGAGWTSTLPANGSGDCNDSDNSKWQLLNGYIDNDGDGYTLGAIQSVCSGASLPSGYVATSLGTDCNDNSAAIHALQTWYLDADNDGHYVSSQSSCGSPGSGYNLTATFNGDCNDNDNTKWQLLNGYIDSDGDGYTLGAIQSICSGASLPSGYSATSLGPDCNDNSAVVHAVVTWYRDLDGDGYYGLTQNSCNNPGTGWSTNPGLGGGDCNDNNSSINPAAIEILGNAIDDNCDGIVDDGSCTTAPGVPVSILGTSPVCPGSTGVYSINPIIGATSYLWSVNGNASVVSGQGSTSVTILFPPNASFTTVTISVRAVNVCGQSNARTRNISKTASTSIPGAISGTLVNCAGTNNLTYSIAPVAGASGYNWVVGAGVAIVSGQGTTSLTVNLEPTFTTSTIKVQSLNSCGLGGTFRSATLTRPTSSFVPAAITGLVNVCPNTNGVTYSISSAANAVSYNWEVGAGATIASGQGTTSITVDFGVYSTTTVKVQSLNTCGTPSAFRSLVVKAPTANTLPGTITGPTQAICGGATQYNYSIAPVAGVSSYLWSVTGGGSVVGGQGTTAITAVFDPTISIKVVSVKLVFGCALSNARNLHVYPLPVINTITGETGGYCGGSTGVTFSVNAVQGASSYEWSPPAGVSITAGQGSTSITTNIGAGFVSGNLCVKTSNSCFSSNATCITLTAVPSSPVAITASTVNPCPTQTVTYSTAAVAGATGYTWSVPSGWSITNGQGTNSVQVTVGNAAGIVSVTADNGCSSSIARKRTIAFNTACRLISPSEEETTATNFEVKVYPNPNNGSVVNIAIEGLQKAASIRILDLLGKEIISQPNIEDELTTVDIQSLAPGVYIVEVIEGSIKKTERLVVSK